jgi:hypothetical protein
MSFTPSNQKMKSAADTEKGDTNAITSPHHIVIVESTSGVDSQTPQRRRSVGGTYRGRSVSDDEIQVMPSENATVPIEFRTLYVPKGALAYRTVRLTSQSLENALPKT